MFPFHQTVINKFQINMHNARCSAIGPWSSVVRSWWMLPDSRRMLPVCMHGATCRVWWRINGGLVCLCWFRLGLIPGCLYTCRIWKVMKWRFLMNLGFCSNRRLFWTLYVSHTVCEEMLNSRCCQLKHKSDWWFLIQFVNSSDKIISING